MAPQTSSIARHVYCALLLTLSVALLPQPAFAQTITYERIAGATVPNTPTTSAVRLRDGKVLILDGTNTWTYDPLTETVTAGLTGVTVAPAGSASVLAHDGTVLATGGLSGTTVLNSSRRVSTSVSTSTLQAGRYNHTATSLRDGRVMLVGGDATSGSATQTASIEIGTQTGNFWSWASSGNLATARAAHTATLDRFGRVIVVGGRQTLTFHTPTNSIELIDVATGIVTAGPSLAVPRYDHRAVTLPDGRILIMGGVSVSGAMISSVEVITPSATGLAVSVAGAMSTARAKHSATVLPDGRVLVTGGSTVSAEYYTPTGTTAAPTLATARTGHTAVTLADGSVVIAGGATAAALELYRPEDGRSGFTIASQVATSFRPAESPLAQLPDGRIVVIGLNTADLYDPASGVTAAPQVLTGISGMTLGTAVAVDATRVLVAGGNSTAVGDLSRIVTITGSTVTSTNGPTIGETRTRPTMARLPDGRVLVLGGYDPAATSSYRSSAVVISSALDSSTTAAAAGVGGYGSSITVTPDGRVIVIGGLQAQSPLRDVLEFDLATNTFSTIASLRFGRYGHSATALDARHILVAGGLGDEGYVGYTGTVEIVDIVSGTTLQLGSGLLQPRGFHAALLQADGTVLIAGGTTGPANLATIEQYDPFTASSLPRFPFDRPRVRPLLTTAPNGQLIVAGTDGTPVLAEIATVQTDAQTLTRLQSQMTALASAAQNASDTVQRFVSWYSQLKSGDASRQHMTTAAPLSAPRSNLAAVTLGDGRVVVTGGGSSTTSQRSTEIFDPATGQWTAGPANQLNANRAAHTATLQPDGRVLLASGTTAELLTPGGTSTTVPGVFPSPLSFPAATTLADGRVLMVGGPFTTAMGMYDPLLQRLLPAGAVAAVRNVRPLAALQNDGSVLIAAGSGSAREVERWTDRYPGLLTSIAVGVSTSSLHLVGLTPGTVIGKSTRVYPSSASTIGITSATATVAADGSVILPLTAFISVAAGPIRLIPHTSGTLGSAVLLGQTTIASLSGFGGGLSLATGDRLTTTTGIVITVAQPAAADANGVFSNVQIEPATAAIAASTGVSVVWTEPAGALAVARQAAAGAVLADGRLFISGGATLMPNSAGGALQVTLQTAEVFDPATGESAVLADRATYVLSHQVATRLPDGRVLITGTDADAFDPATGELRLEAVSAVNRAQHSATLMSDGRVLIAGGTTTIVEIYAGGTSFDDLTARVGVLEQSVAELTTERDGLASQVAALTAEVTSLQGQLGTMPAQIVALQAQLAATEEQLTTATTQIADLQGQLALANSANTTLQQSNTDLQDQVNALQTQLGQQATVIAGLQVQITDAANAIVLRDQTIAARDLTIATQNTTIATQGATITSLNADNASLTQQVGDLNGLLSIAVADNASLTTQLADANQTIAARDTTITQLSGEKTALEATVAALTADKTALQAEVSSLTTQLADAVQTIATRDTTIAQQTATIASLTDDKNALTASVGTLTAEKSTLETQVGSLTTQLATANQTIVTRDATITQLASEKAALEAAATALTADKTALQTEVSSLTTQLADANLVITTRDATIAQLTTELAMASQAIADREATITQQAATIASLTDANNALTTQLAAANADNAALTAQLATATQTIGLQQDTIAVLIVDKAALQSSLDTATTTIAGLNAQVTTLTADKAALAVQLTNTESALSDRIAELLAANQTIAQQQGAIDTLTTEKTALQTSLDAATTSIAARDATIAQQQSTIATLTTDKAVLQSQLNAANASVATLTADNTALQTQVTTLTSQKTALESQVTSLQAQVLELQQQLQHMVNVEQFLGRVQDVLTIMRRAGFVIPGATPQAQVENLVNAISDMPRGARLQLLKELVDERGNWRGNRH